jgi:hypothetical protein
MPKYTGVVKPEDWLSDYGITVDIAGSNKRVAVHYAPCFKDLPGRGSTVCRLYRSTRGTISRRLSSRISLECTSDLPARGSWPSASKAQTSQIVTISRDGQSCATRARE